MAADALQARGERGILVLTQSSAGARVRGAEGNDHALGPPRAKWHSLLATPAGWIAAGTELAGDGSRLLIAERHAGTVRALAPPPTAGAVRSAVLLARNGRLAALAWIEGNEVRAAQRLGATWSAPNTIASPSLGMTMGLAATTLDDGTQIILWSAFDGEDDEIYWSARIGGRQWTRPARLAGDNTVPDITPAVRAVPGGAMAAWSRFDGTEYELVLARFEAGAWTAPRRIAGAGALRPTFPDLPGAPLLLYRAARPLGWAVLEVGGRIAEVARSPDPRADRPLVERQHSTARVLWPVPAEIDPNSR